MKKKLALILFGYSKESYYHKSQKRFVNIDYKLSINNYKKRIFNYFNDLGYDIDIFISTNEMSEDNKKQILADFNPIAYEFIESENSKLFSRNTKLKNALEFCINSNNTYDHILCTRFDLIFNKDFHKSVIDFEKFNLVSVLEEPHLICDNFYLFPGRLLSGFHKICSNNITAKCCKCGCSRCSAHYIKHYIEKLSEVNYILNENNVVAFLSFYTIVRN
jgi:hypothetical protein